MNKLKIGKRKGEDSDKPAFLWPKDGISIFDPLASKTDANTRTVDDIEENYFMFSLFGVDKGVPAALGVSSAPFSADYFLRSKEPWEELSGGLLSTQSGFFCVMRSSKAEEWLDLPEETRRQKIHEVTLAPHGWESEKEFFSSNAFQSLTDSLLKGDLYPLCPLNPDIWQPLSSVTTFDELNEALSRLEEPYYIRQEEWYLTEKEEQELKALQTYGKDLNERIQTLYEAQGAMAVWHQVHGLYADWDQAFWPAAPGKSLCRVFAHRNEDREIDCLLFSQSEEALIEIFQRYKTVCSFVHVPGL